VGARDDPPGRDRSVDLRPGRLAVVLALNGDAARLVDDVRERWDRVMRGRIGAHVTLLHDVEDDDALPAALTRVAGRPPIELTLTSTACWGPLRYGIYLDIDDHTGAVAELYEELAELESPRWRRTEYRPHVTLLHGRTVSEESAVRAWAELQSWRPEHAARIDAITVLRLGDDRWHEIERVPLGAPPASGPRR